MLDQRAPVQFLELSFAAVRIAHGVDLRQGFTERADRRVEKAHGFPFGDEWAVEARKEAGHSEPAVPDPPAAWRRC